MLSSHPRIYICFELSLYNVRQPRKGDVTSEEFLRTYFKTGGFRWLGISPERILERLPSPLPPDELWRAYEEMMAQKAARYGRPRFGDKTPGHTKHLGRIYRDFPNAKVIMTVRDPRSAVPGAQRMPWGSRKDAVNALIYDGILKQVEPYLDRLLLVRLEDLQANPREQMERVLQFVGEEWDERVLDHANNHPDAEPVPPLPWLKSSSSKVMRPAPAWEGLDPVRLRTIERLCKKSMEAYGYEPAPLDEEPSKAAVTRNIYGAVPELARYARAWLHLIRYVRKPGGWDWNDEEMHRRFRGLNPEWWPQHPDFVWPTISDEEAPADRGVS